MDENIKPEENFHPNSSSSSAPAQDENATLKDQLEDVLIESIATLTRLTALVTELQVECVRREEEFARVYNPRLLEAAREILDGEDPFDKIQEESFTDLDTELDQE